MLRRAHQRINRTLHCGTQQRDAAARWQASGDETVTFIRPISTLQLQPQYDCVKRQFLARQLYLREDQPYRNGQQRMTWEMDNYVCARNTKRGNRTCPDRYPKGSFRVKPRPHCRQIYLVPLVHHGVGEPSKLGQQSIEQIPSDTVRQEVS